MKLIGVCYGQLLREFYPIACCGVAVRQIAKALPFATDRDVDEVTHAHNQVLDLFLVGGLPAAILYSALFLIIAYRVRTGRPPTEAVGLMILLRSNNDYRVAVSPICYTHRNGPICYYD